MQPYGLHLTLFLFTRILFFRPRLNIPIFLPILLYLFGKKKNKINNNNFKVSKQFHRTHSVIFLGCIELWTKAVLSSDGAFFKNIVVLRDREEWSPETWAKACKNEQHIGSIKDLRPQKISNLLTFKPQMNMPQNVGSIKDLTSKNIHWVDTLNSAKLIVLREN